MTLVLGVDGCKKQWLAAHVDPEAGQVEWALLPTAQEVVNHATAAGAVAVGVDVPIGLSIDGSRRCDVEARKLIKPRTSSVFPAPIRAVLGASSYDEARERSKQNHRAGNSLMIQTFSILKNIEQWDAVVTPDRQRWLVEVHPEVSFFELAGQVLGKKKDLAGRNERLTALRHWLPDVDDVVKAKPAGAPMDDALDALAAAWTAQRWAEGRARVLPVKPELDEKGRWMEIVV